MAKLFFPSTLFRAVIPVTAALLLLNACGKSDDGTDNNGNSTDEFKKEMLVNYADNIIQPGYVQLKTSLADLKTKVAVLLSAPSASTQANVKPSFQAAYQAFEAVSLPYFGPAAAQMLNNTLNTFPPGISKIESGIASGNYDLTLPITSDSLQGFPALDYLIFGEGAVDKLADPVSGQNRKQYINDVLERMQLLTDNTINQWAAGYRNTFINSLKTDVGSSIGFLINQLAFEMDALKGPRIGWPFGKQSNGIVFADKAEGYYSAISKELAVANLNAVKQYYTGGSAKGIDDYLDLLGKTTLNDDVLAQFTVAINALQAIPAPLSAAFTGSPATVEAAYKEIQKLLTLLKTDVASATGVQINYMDNDGD
ncbi:imelysin family protein [Flavihumibacter petaseus]|uniref:Peptidase M75 family protein n=1 Tax=Flavihumibacter petaseus NBRC 106054 TaxID=1220578 RepID=A0A0E9N4Y8_9BACT|nr:imelysin family protein [Flavihumibacter petaseus]GAO44863.1 peptidase M75 family protein [Flavihumibacter petaseus NBRC 106054]